MRSIRNLLPLLLAFLVLLTSACSSTRLAEPHAQASTTQPAATQENTAVAASVKAQKANLRNAPSKSASVVTTLNKGDLLSLISATPTGPWYQVRDSKTGSQGWIHGNSIVLLQTTTPPPRTTTPSGSGKSYVNVDGVRVPSPVFSETKPDGATARCRDGSYSFSQHRRGTCSHHGGVAEWF
jgi:Protein of unknown function (DUF3761)/Bacterial SH3 domain